MFRSAFLAFTTSIAITSIAGAQDSGPAIVSERIQEIASELNISERLDFKWEAAGPGDVGRYMGLLAAANEVAKTIALNNDREIPSDEDYQAALAAFCLWPNKPPLAEPYWDNAYAAFGNEAVREALQTAVGPLAVSLPALIANGSGAAVVSGEWPTDTRGYLEGVLDLESLNDVE